MDKKVLNDEIAACLRMALDWIDAVPSDLQLPAMPGFDRDYVDSVIARYDQPAQPAAIPGKTDLFPISVLGDPMREYAPGKWETATWPSAQPADEGVDRSTKHLPPEVVRSIDGATDDLTGDQEFVKGLCSHRNALVRGLAKALYQRMQSPASAEPSSIGYIDRGGPFGNPRAVLTHVFSPDGNLWQDGARIYAAPVAAQRCVPDGWKLVPVEPSIAMCIRGAEVTDQAINGHGAAQTYAAMLNAAPAPPAADQAQQEEK